MTNFVWENTWKENKESFKTKKVALIPVGSNEQHGPALPTGTDWMIADYIAKKVGESSESVMVTPVIPFGHALYHNDFEGTLAVSQSTLIAYVTEICEQMIKYGCTHILFINGHGGNNNALYTVGQNLRHQGIPVANIQWFEIACCLNKEWGLRGHGDITETAFMLHIAPETVKMDQAHLPVNKKLGNMQLMDLQSMNFEGARVYINTRTSDVSDSGDLIEYGHSAGMDYSVSAVGATAKMGKEICDAVVGYICRFIEEFKDISF